MLTLGFFPDKINRLPLMYNYHEVPQKVYKIIELYKDLTFKTAYSPSTAYQNY